MEFMNEIIAGLIRIVRFAIMMTILMAEWIFIFIRIHLFNVIVMKYFILRKNPHRSNIYE